MKLLLSRDLSKCRIDKASLSSFPKAAKLKRIFSEAADVTLSYLELDNILEGADVSVLVTNDGHIQELNLKTRKKDKPTNVLSFPYMDFKKGKLSANNGHYILGDIVFGIETCVKEAKEQNKEIIDHLTHLFVHSILHLLGFDHMKKKEAGEMEGLEVKILKRLGISNPY